MAVTTLAPNLINFVQGNPYLNDSNSNLKRKVAIDGISLTTANSVVNSIIALGSIPSNAILDNIVLYNDLALDSNVSPTLSIDVGIYTMDNIGNLAAVSSAAFLSSSAIAQGTNPSGVSLIDSSIITAAKRYIPIWSAIGQSSDPVTQYIVGIKIHTVAATPQASPIAWKLSWDMN